MKRNYNFFDLNRKIHIALFLILSLLPLKVFAEKNDDFEVIRKQTYWYGYSWGTISQTCLFYRDGIIDLKTGQKEVSSALEILGAKAPGYIEQVIDAMSYPQFEGCLDLVE